MMNYLHTKGPWFVDDSCGELRIIAGDLMIARVAQHHGGVGKANAHLIAAGPELLEMLEIAVARIELANAESDPILSAWLPDARAVITKAEGRLA